MDKGLFPLACRLFFLMKCGSWKPTPGADIKYENSTCDSSSSSSSSSCCCCSSSSSFSSSFSLSLSLFLSLFFLPLSLPFSFAIARQLQANLLEGKTERASWPLLLRLKRERPPGARLCFAHRHQGTCFFFYLNESKLSTNLLLIEELKHIVSGFWCAFAWCFLFSIG